MEIYNKIHLKNLDLKTFTKQDAIDYCILNNINIEDIISLDLSSNNRLTDISGIKIFENLQYLDLRINKLKDISILKDLNNLKFLNINYNNQIKDISVLKNLTELKSLSISDTRIKDISVLKYLNNLKLLNISSIKVKDISVVQYLNKLEILDIRDLKLESSQVQYINSIKNLKELWCINGFNDISVINQLNKNIELW